jgi:hypothetical protein
MALPVPALENIGGNGVKYGKALFAPKLADMQ